MKHIEAQFLSGPFKKWCESKDNKLPSFVFEAKTTRGKDSLLFSQVEPHQVIALHQAKHSIKYYKIADDSRGTKPFDGAVWRGTDAYLVIEYPSFWCMIDIDSYENEERTSERRSITSARALQIACVVVDK